MKPIHVCVPVLKRYDLLRNLLLSLGSSTVRPTMVHIVDNGLDPARMHVTRAVCDFSTDVFQPNEPMGVAESWNWFIDHVPEERIICNDDLVFAADSIEKLIATEGAFVSALPGSNACSCFLLRDECISKVGQFDETISPGYAYFEDCDYVERMIEQKIPITGCECGVVHIGSQTIAVNDAEAWQKHNDRFLLAQNNFVKKWGRLPNVPGPHWPKVEAAL